MQNRHARCTVCSADLERKTKLVYVKYVINKEFCTKHQNDSEVCDIDTGFRLIVLQSLIVSAVSSPLFAVSFFWSTLFPIVLTLRGGANTPTSG